MRDRTLSPGVRPAQADVSRRTFLSALAVTTAACGLAVKGTEGTEGTEAAGAAGAANPGLASWTVADFESLRGDTFLVRDAEGRTYPLRLAAAETAGQPAPSRSGRAAFSLLFQSSPDGPARQDLYELRHPRLGTFSLLLVPVGRPRHAVVLEAILS